jgi:hypothetical protein
MATRRRRGDTSGRSEPKRTWGLGGIWWIGKHEDGEEGGNEGEDTLRDCQEHHTDHKFVSEEKELPTRVVDVQSPEGPDSCACMKERTIMDVEDTLLYLITGASISTENRLPPPKRTEKVSANQ